MCRVGGAKRGKARSLSPGVHRGHPLCVGPGSEALLCRVQGRSPCVSPKVSPRSGLRSMCFLAKRHVSHITPNKDIKARGANGLAHPHSPLADWTRLLADCM